MWKSFILKLNEKCNLQTPFHENIAKYTLYVFYLIGIGVQIFVNCWLGNEIKVQVNMYIHILSSFYIKTKIRTFNFRVKIWLHLFIIASGITVQTN